MNRASYEYQREIAPHAVEAAQRWRKLSHSHGGGEELAYLREILGLEEFRIFENHWSDRESEKVRNLSKFGEAYLADVTYEQAVKLWDEYQLLMYRSEYHRDDITEMALRLSLCPLHFVDYASCFDDLDPECYQIRAIHPNHDT